MDYRVWSESYWREASRVKERMNQIRREPKTGNKEEQILRQRRLAILYDMYLDCTHTAKLLAARAYRERSGS